MSWEEIIKVEKPESKEEELKELKEELKYRNSILSNLRKIEKSLMPFSDFGVVRQFPKMEKRMKDMSDYVKSLIPHYKQLIEETEDSIKRIGE